MLWAFAGAYLGVLYVNLVDNRHTVTTSDFRRSKELLEACRPSGRKLGDKEMHDAEKEQDY